LVTLADGGIAGVEGIGDRFDGADENVIGELVVDGEAQAFGGNDFVAIEMSDLALGVDAGVGPGGADEIYFMADDEAESAAEFFLDGGDAVALGGLGAFP
jgi:hypothetical protein